MRVTVTYMQAVVTAVLLEPCRPGHGSPWRTVRARAAPIFGWCLLATTVVVISQRFEDVTGILGRVLRFLPRLVWAGASFLAIPIIIAEDVGPFQALRRSVALFRSTWGQQLVAGFSVLVLSLLAVGVVAICALLTWAIAGRTAATLVVLILWIAWGVVLATLLSAFRAALYAYALGLPPVIGFERAPLEEAYRAERPGGGASGPQRPLTEIT